MVIDLPAGLMPSPEALQVTNGGSKSPLKITQHGKQLTFTKKSNKSKLSATSINLQAQGNGVIYSGSLSVPRFDIKHQPYTGDIKITPTTFNLESAIQTKNKYTYLEKKAITGTERINPDQTTQPEISYPNAMASSNKKENSIKDVAREKSANSKIMKAVGYSMSDNYQGKVIRVGGTYGAGNKNNPSDLPTAIFPVIRGGKTSEPGGYNFKSQMTLSNYVDAVPAGANPKAENGDLTPREEFKVDDANTVPVNAYQDWWQNPSPTNRGYSTTNKWRQGPVRGQHNVYEFIQRYKYWGPTSINDPNNNIGYSGMDRVHITYQFDGFYPKIEYAATNTYWEGDYTMLIGFHDIDSSKIRNIAFSINGGPAIGINNIENQPIYKDSDNGGSLQNNQKNYVVAKATVPASMMKPHQDNKAYITIVDSEGNHGPDANATIKALEPPKPKDPDYNITSQSLSVGGSYGDDPLNKVDDFYTNSASLINPAITGNVTDYNGTAAFRTTKYFIDDNNRPSVGSQYPLSEMLEDTFNTPVSGNGQRTNFTQRNTRLARYSGKYVGTHSINSYFVDEDASNNVVDYSNIAVAELKVKGFYPIIKWDSAPSEIKDGNPYNFSLKYQDLDSDNVNFYYTVNGGSRKTLATNVYNSKKYLKDNYSNNIPLHPDLSNTINTKSYGIPNSDFNPGKSNNLQVFAIDSDGNKSMVLNKNVESKIKNPLYNITSTNLSVGGSYGDDPLNKVDNFYTDSASLINPAIKGNITDYNPTAFSRTTQYYVDNYDKPNVGSSLPSSEMLEDTFNTPITGNGQRTSFTQNNTRLAKYSGKYVGNHNVNSYFVDKHYSGNVLDYSNQSSFNLNVKGFYPILKWDSNPSELSKDQPYNFSLKYQDLDSDKVNFYYKLNDGSQTPIMTNVTNSKKYIKDNYANTIPLHPYLGDTIGNKSLSIPFNAFKPGTSNKLQVYSIDSDGNKSMVLTRQVMVQGGELRFTSAPTEINWDKIEIGDQSYEPTQILGDLSVTDTRSQKNPWTMSVKETKPLSSISEGSLIDGGLMYMNNGKATKLYLNQNVPILTHSNTNDAPFVINNLWNPRNGLFFQSYVGDQHVNTNYAGELTWTLSQAPVNS